MCFCEAKQPASPPAAMAWVGACFLSIECGKDATSSQLPCVGTEMARGGDQGLADALMA